MVKTKYSQYSHFNHAFQVVESKYVLIQKSVLSIAEPFFESPTFLTKKGEFKKGN